MLNKSKINYIYYIRILSDWRDFIVNGGKDDCAEVLVHLAMNNKLCMICILIINIIKYKLISVSN